MSYSSNTQDGSSTAARWSRWPGAGVGAAANVATMCNVSRHTRSTFPAVEAPSSADV